MLLTHLRRLYQLRLSAFDTLDPVRTMAGIWGNGGQGGQFPLEQWFYEMPPVTRWWTVATVATSVLVQCHVVTPFQLFYSFRAVYVKSQVSWLGRAAGNRTNNSSIGGFSRHFSTSDRSAWTCSFMSSSYSGTRVSWRSRLADPRHTSHGFSSTP